MKWSTNQQGEAVVQPRSVVALFWYITLGMFLFGLCLVLAGVIIGRHHENPNTGSAAAIGLTACGLLFWASAIIPAIIAIKEGIAAAKLKGVEFITERLPLSVGSRFCGVMRLRGQSPSDKDLNVRLFCRKYIPARRFTSTYRTRPSYDTIWEDTCRVSPDSVKISRNDISITVDFTIPYACHTSDANSSYKWWLQYKHVRFELPVTRDQYSDAKITEDSVTRTKLIEAPEILLQAWERSRILFSRPNNRTLMLDVPPVIQRHPAHFIFMMLLSAVIALAGYQMFWIPDIAPRIIGSFLLLGTALCAVVTLRMLLTFTTIRLGPEGLGIVRNHGFFKTGRVIPLSDIGKFKFEISSSGSVNEKETVNYRLIVRLSCTAQRAIEEDKSLKKSIKQFFLIYDEPEVQLIGALKDKEMAEALDCVLNGLLDQLHNNSAEASGTSV